MNISYYVTGPERKALVAAISEVLALAAVYKGAPTFAYEIGNCTVDKNGTLSFSEAVNSSAAALLIAALKERGYEGESQDADETPDLQMTEREELGLGREHRDPVDEDGMQASDVPESDSNNLEISVPREGFSNEAIENLKKLIASKDTLIKKALDLYDLPFNEDCLAFKVEEDKLCFPWFTLRGIDGEADAYSRFICALCSMAKTQKRITATEKPVENDKFAMRLFLVRLGLKGPENKVVRQIMLKSLTGNGSWKSGRPPEKKDEVQADVGEKS